MGLLVMSEGEAIPSDIVKPCEVTKLCPCMVWRVSSFFKENCLIRYVENREGIFGCEKKMKTYRCQGKEEQSNLKKLNECKCNMNKTQKRIL